MGIRTGDKIKYSYLAGFNRDLERLTVYRGIKSDKILSAICAANLLVYEMRNFSAAIEKYHEACSLLINAAEDLGLTGNIFGKYIAFLVLRDENPFSLAAEKYPGQLNDSMSVYQAAKSDFKRLGRLFKFSFGFAGFGYLCGYKPVKERPHPELTGLLGVSDDGSTANFIAEYHGKNGAGYMAEYPMFIVNGGNRTKQLLTPARNNDTITLDDIIGYGYQKEKLSENTRAFANGLPANNTLLIGARGTGKSSMVKAIANEYFSKKIRLIEITKDDLRKIPVLLKYLSGRGLKFIIFLDDLSFEENEPEYKYLKSILEGSSEKKPDNVMFYATSNRRHIIAEKWSDKQPNVFNNDVGGAVSGELHTSDTVNEKLSLSDRFGLTIAFLPPTPREFYEIVEGIARREKLPVSNEVLNKEANKWELAQSGLSGRVAKQFADYLAHLYPAPRPHDE